MKDDSIMYTELAKQELARIHACLPNPDGASGPDLLSEIQAAEKVLIGAGWSAHRAARIGDAAAAEFVSILRLEESRYEDYPRHAGRHGDERWPPTTRNRFVEEVERLLQAGVPRKCAIHDAGSLCAIELTDPQLRNLYNRTKKKMADDLASVLEDFVDLDAEERSSE